MTPDSAAAVEFLRRWSPTGPWSLVGIEVDRKGLFGITTDKMEGVQTWLDAHNGNVNIYFHVNPLRKTPKRAKAERSDIASLSWLHVDLDPRKGEDLERERERILYQLNNPPEPIPKPTVIVFSGGGYQGFWKLARPRELDGSLGQAEEAKRYNLQLEVQFEADNCHNIDRIMRLPGTLNLPDAKKVRAGREVALAQLVSWEEGNVYALESFTSAPLVQSGGEDDFTAAATARIVIPGNIRRLTDIDELDDHGQVTDVVKATIVQGCHPTEPGKYTSRSEALFAVVCSLIRASIPDEVIYSVITDSNFGISESVLDKGSRVEQYALKQMASAHEEAVDPWLRKLNSVHAVISNVGGGCKVMEEVPSGLGRTELTYQSFEAFRNRYMNKKVEVAKGKDGSPVRVPVGKWWLEHEQRCQYDQVVFSPGNNVPGAYNLWKGFACDAMPGDCTLFLEHMFDNICKQVDEHYTYLLGWMARCVQKPDSPGHTAIVLRGERGTGKSFFAREFGSLWGRHFLTVSDSKHLVGSFNAHLRDTVVLFADEAFWAGDRKHESILKTLVTEETIGIEAKGVDLTVQPNYVHLIMASNNQWIVPAGAHERRFFVLDVGGDHMQDLDYFAALRESMEKGGREALLHFLLHLDLSKFEVRKVPATMALREQQLLTLTSEEEWWYGKLVHGQVIAGNTWGQELRKDSVIDDYLLYSQRVGSRRSHATALGRFIKTVCPGVKSSQKLVEIPNYEGDRIQRERHYFFTFPPLARCRAQWDSLRGVPHDWGGIPEFDDPPQIEAPF